MLGESLFKNPCWPQNWSDISVASGDDWQKRLEALESGRMINLELREDQAALSFHISPFIWLSQLLMWIGAPSDVPAVTCGWAHIPCDTAGHPTMFSEEGHFAGVSVVSLIWPSFYITQSRREKQTCNLRTGC